MTSETRDSINDIWGERTPHGAGQEWPARVDERVSETPERWVRGACVLCSNGCGLDIGVKDGRIVGVRGLVSDATNKGRLGPKGLHGWEANNSGDRLVRPMIRRDGQLREASWDEAMDLIVQKSQEIALQHTSGALGFYTSGQLFLEEYYTLAVIGKAGLGTPHMDGNTRLCTATAAAALKESFGSDGQPGSYEDLDVTDCVLHVGHNVASQQTVLWMRVLDRLAGSNPPRVIVIDPRRTFTAEKATVHLAPKVGTNVAVLNGLLHLIIQAGKTDPAFLQAHTVGYDDLKRVVEKYTPEYVEELSGVPTADLRAAGEILANTKTLVSTVLQGVYQSMQATAAAVQVNNIHLIRGLIGKPGSGILQMNGQPTAQNTRETGADGDLPGFRNWGNPEHIGQLAKLWNVPFNKIPHWSPPTHAMQIWRYCEQGSIKMLWIQATNPAVSLPDLGRIRRILQQEDLFVVVQDAFLTETARYADVVLPAAIWGEKTGTFTNVSRTVHISCQAIEPPGEAKSDLDIFLDYARRMDFRDQDGGPLIRWHDAESAFEAWKECTRGRPCDYTGLTYGKLLAGSGIPWPVNEGHPDGTVRLYTDFVFPTHADYAETYGQDFDTGASVTPEEYKANDPQGRAMIKATDYREPHEVPDEDYPLWLTTGRQVYHFHTRTKTGRSKELREAAPDAFVQLSPEDAARYGIEQDDWILVESRRGLVIERALIGNIEPGLVFIPWHYGSWDDPSRPRAANELTLTEWDPVSKQPHYKYAAVRVSKYDAKDALPTPGLLGRAVEAVRHLVSGEKERASFASESGVPQPKTTQRVDG
ncbi:nitrate reductase catalytic subunit (plasmid) [Deinococcus aetherius]|uniref:Nitrate reductase catalytic subunit n=1 Tax=Deinococcus aetherius TaxID=200252 RepID=A0ABM8ALA1_9DEIO|nr:nitrate reductase [Deinococcus aetherius]BDP44603.1 nitrate reductase catalytic subunit [Deinococcus aetherius]